MIRGRLRRTVCTQDDAMQSAASAAAPTMSPCDPPVACERTGVAMFASGTASPTLSVGLSA